MMIVARSITQRRPVSTPIRPLSFAMSSGHRNVLTITTKRTPATSAQATKQTTTAPTRNPRRLKLSEGETPRVVAEFSDYDELINALRTRAAELNLSGEQVDRRSGLPDRYAQKLLGPNQIRRLGAISLGPFLGALAVRGLLIEDRAAVEKLRRQTTPRDLSFVRSAPSIVFTVRFFKKDWAQRCASAR